MLPVFGTRLVIVFVKPRSDCCGVSLTLSMLLASFASGWSECEIVAVLVSMLGLATVATICSVCGGPIATVPTVHTPVPLLYVPCDGVADAKDTPTGSVSCTVTFVAMSGPAFDNVTV